MGMADSALLLLSTCSTHRVAPQSRENPGRLRPRDVFRLRRPWLQPPFISNIAREMNHTFPSTQPVQPLTLVGLRVVNGPFGAVSESLHGGWLNIIRHAQLRVGKVAFPGEVFRL